MAAINDKVGKGNVVFEKVNGKMTMKKVDTGPAPNRTLTQKLGNTTMNSFNDRELSNSIISSQTNHCKTKSLAVLEMMKHSA